MNFKTADGVHWSFWAVGAGALIWNLMGVMNFFMQMNPETVANMPQSYRAIVEARPLWATGAFVIAVFGGALGSLLLLFRKSAAYYVFIASLLGVIVQMTTTLGQLSATIGVGISVLVVAFLIWYSKHAESNGWIR